MAEVRKSHFLRLEALAYICRKRAVECKMNTKVPGSTTQNATSLLMNICLRQLVPGIEESYGAQQGVMMATSSTGQASSTIHMEHRQVQEYIGQKYLQARRCAGDRMDCLSEESVYRGC